MNKKFIFGIVLTILWCFACGAFVWCKGLDSFIQMSFPDMGNFFAGAISPIAFLWLILGYMQQGDELKQNTQALNIQADQLKLAVDEYRHLVAATAKQAELLEEEHKARQAQEEFKNQILLSPGASNRSEISTGSVKHHRSFKNMGAAVSNVKISCTLPYFQQPQYLLHLAHEQVINLDFECAEAKNEEERGVLTFDYIDPNRDRRQYVLYVGVKMHSLKIAYRPDDF